MALPFYSPDDNYLASIRTFRYMARSSRYLKIFFWI